MPVPRTQNMTKHPHSLFVLASFLAIFPGCTVGDPSPADGGPVPANPSVDPSEGDPTPTTSGDIATTTEDPDDPSTTSTTSLDSTETTDPTTTTATTSTTDAPPICGDGVQDPGEQCDDGEANSDNAFCTVQCTVNVCGDGHKFVDVELCDEGIANSDQYGSFCGADCTPGIFCGDGVTQQAEGEECDHGPNNGEDDTNLSCDGQCSLVARRGFITAAAFTGNLGGLDGADDKCRTAALLADFPEPNSFHAVLSTDTMSANERLTPLLGDPLPYILPGGQKFADSYSALMTTGPGDTGINMTENGEPLHEVIVATNTTPTGDSVLHVPDPDDPDAPPQDCAGWTSSSKNLFGLGGINAFTQENPNWSNWKMENWWVNKSVWSCDKSWFHIYCLEF